MKTETAIIENRQEAVEVIEKFRKLELEIIAVEQKHGLDAKRREVATLKLQVVGYMKRAKKSQIDLDSAHVTLIQPSRKTWIGTDKDMPAAAKGKKSLRAILGRELWMKVSKRVVDPEKLNNLIEDGKITEEQVAPAFVELPISPFLRYYEGK